MLSIRARLALYYGLAFVAVIALLLVFRPAPDVTDNPAYDALATAHTRKLASQAVALDSARTALIKDQGATLNSVTRYVKVRDTLNIHDTVQVKVFVAKADSVVRACTDLAESCAVFRVRAESSLAGLTADRDLWRTIAAARKPSKWAPVKEWAIRIGIGYGAFRLGQGMR